MREHTFSRVIALTAIPAVLRRTVRASLCAACVFTLAPTKLLRAQTVVSVQSAGVAVPSADVSIWDVQGRVGSGRTSGIGTVRVELERPLNAGPFLLVRRLGFAPARVPFAMRDSMSVELNAVATTLPVLAVRTKELHCPSRTEPEADSVWRASAARYSMRLTRFRIDWTGYFASETVTAEQRGYADPYPMRPPALQRAGFIHGQPGMEDPPPYAMYERHIGVAGEYWQWRYADLSNYSADHFLSERFRAQHALVVLGRTESTTTLGFCPRDDSQADLRGELLVGVDASLIGGRWSFHVPHDDEDAGGEATFAPTVYDGREYLVAIRGTFWRRAGKNVYNQRRFENVAWTLTPRDTVRLVRAVARPPLPTRFQPEIDAFLRADAVSAPPVGGIEFVGSSIIRLWNTLAAQMAPLPAFNRGFGGSQTRDVLHYMDRIVVPYRPRFVVYYCGSNDVTAGETADSIVARVQEFHQRLQRQLPATRMFFLSVLHAPEKRTKWTVVDSVNARMRRYAASASNFEYVDINPPLLDARGEVRGSLYLPDSLHYVPGAYDLFTGVVKPVLVRAWAAP